MGLNFQRHLQKEHNIWAYFDYMSQISRKSTVDCNLFELNIKKKIEKRDFSWIPLQRAQIIGNNFLIFYIYFMIFLLEKHGYKHKVNFKDLKQAIYQLNEQTT